jgi:tetratricopeptide (TPR) repeat protein
MEFLAVSLMEFAIHPGSICLPPALRADEVSYLNRNPSSAILHSRSPLRPADDIVIRDMSWKLPRLIPSSAPVILLVLTLAAATGFAAVSHLVTRYNLNQQARGRRLYQQGVVAAGAGHYDDAIDAFRAALTCDPTNSQYQLSLARALRDSNDPRRLDEAESYLLALWQRTPQDAAVNLALARVEAHRDSIEDATRYYHNAMYGVWNSDQDANRSRARIELIQFLLKRNVTVQAESEIMALAAGLPRDPAAHLQTAQLFAQAQDYANALAQYEEVLHLDPDNPSALAGAGEAAYRSGNYVTAQRYLRSAVNANREDSNSRELLETAELILRVNPFVSHISDAERNRRIAAAFSRAGDRLTECAQQTGVDLSSTAPAAKTAVAKTTTATSVAPTSDLSPLLTLQSRWAAAKPDLSRLRSPGETDLPDAIMDVVFQIEQQSAAVCGQPKGLDLALLLISQKREAASQ